MNRRRFLTTLPAFLLANPVLAEPVGPGVALIFVGTSWCPYCAEIAPLILPVERDAGVPVLVASLDNQPIYPFPEWVDGRAHPLTRQFDQVPQVLVYNQRLDDITHVIGSYRNPRHFIQLLGLAFRQSQGALG